MRIDLAAERQAIEKDLNEAVEQVAHWTGVRDKLIGKMELLLRLNAISQQPDAPSPNGNHADS